MKQNFIRNIIYFLCAAILIFASFTACSSPSSDSAAAPDTPSTPAASGGTGSSDASSPESLPYVELKMYLIGEPARDYDMMLEVLNDKMREDINATLKVEWCGWGEFGTKYPLMLASGEPIDITYASTWTRFYDEAAKGAFLDLTDLMPLYAPKTLAEITPDFKDQVTIDGKMLAVPAAFYQYGMMGYIVRGDYMEKFGMTAINGVDDYGLYLKNVREDPDINILGGEFIATSDGLDSYWGYTKGHVSIKAEPFFVMSDDGKNAQVVPYYDYPDLIDHYKKMREWSEAGYWPKDVLATTEQDMWRNGKVASRLHNFDSWRNTNLHNPEWEAEFYFGRPRAEKTVAMQDGMALPIASPNPERALMLLELLRQDRSYYDLMTYGIEGIHFEITAAGELQPLDSDGFAPEGYCSWGFKEPKFLYKQLGMPPNIDDVRAELERISYVSPYALFNPDWEPIKNERAAMLNVEQEYRQPLAYGYVADVEAGFATLMEQLEISGMRIIQAELQRQLDEFLAN